MRFYTGKMFPEKYRNGIFIAEHGSWNRSTPVGYRVTFVKIEGGRAVSYEPFAQGWLKGSIAAGRPADVLVMQDGSLLVADDKAGPHLPHHLQKLGGGLRPPSDASPRTPDCAGEAGARTAARATLAGVCP
jgi:glucose/arabinose dehydrogenase